MHAYACVCACVCNLYLIQRGLEFTYEVLFFIGSNVWSGWLYGHCLKYPVLDPYMCLDTLSFLFLGILMFLL